MPATRLETVQLNTPQLSDLKTLLPRGEQMGETAKEKVRLFL